MFKLLTSNQPQDNKAGGSDGEEREELDGGDAGVEVGGDLCGGAVEERYQEEENCGHQLY